MTFLKQHYGATEGPLGFPMLDRQAQALDGVLRSLPKEDAFTYRKGMIAQATTELSPGERADVSWISTEDIDRQGDIVLARGMDDSHFKLNPIVTLNHCYAEPPVGKSLWRKRVKDGERHGIKAKTHYPPRPEGWPESETWMPDYAFNLVRTDLLRGKSIGFLPTKVRRPSEEEITHRPELAAVRYIIEEWLLLEYACVWMPAQQNAVVEQVSKSWAGEVVPHCRLRTLAEALSVRINPTALVARAVGDAFARARGRI